MIQFDEHIFQMGWFNHQLESTFFEARGGPSVWSWEEDHGRPCGLSKWHCFLGLKVGGLGRWVLFKPDGGGFWRDVGVCVFFGFKGGEGWSLTIQKGRFLQVFFLKFGREGGKEVIWSANGIWFFCGSFRVRKWFGILFKAHTTKEHQFPISCNGGSKIGPKRHQLKKGSIDGEWWGITTLRSGVAWLPPLGVGRQIH